MACEERDNCSPCAKSTLSFISIHLTLTKHLVLFSHKKECVQFVYEQIL